MAFFETNAFRCRLIAGGFTEEQADTAVTVTANSAGHALATKGDLVTRKIELRAELRELEQRLTQDVGGTARRRSILGSSLLSTDPSGCIVEALPRQWSEETSSCAPQDPLNGVLAFWLKNGIVKAVARG